MSLYGRVLEQRRREFDARVRALHERRYSDEYIARVERCAVGEVVSSLRRTRARAAAERGRGDVR